MAKIPIKNVVFYTCILVDRGVNRETSYQTMNFNWLTQNFRHAPP